MEFNKGIYIGAGKDIEPVFDYPEVLEWVFLDSQPLSEFGIHRDKGFERPNFLKNLKNKYKLFDFNLKAVNDNTMIFENLDRCQRITYICNTAFPEELEKYNELLSNWNYIVVKGFIPKIDIMKYCRTDSKLNFCGGHNTVYQEDIDKFEGPDLVNKLYCDQKLEQKFKNFTFKYASKIFNFKNIKDFNHHIKMMY